MTKRNDIDRLRDPRVAEAVASFLPEQVFQRVVRNPENLERVGERRTVTVIFIDIAGFTPYCEGRDAEEVMLLLNRLFAAILEPVEKYAGTVDKFLGDAAVVLFGAPVVHENDPHRALAAALEILERVREFPGLEVSIGINTGEVVAGIVGNDRHREYTVIGDAVNTASRLQNAAASGEILVGEETYTAVGTTFIFGPPRELSLKGKSRTSKAWSLISEGRATANDEIVRVIGRGRELESLFDIVSGEKRTALLIGEPGTGKSALVRRLVIEARKSGLEIIDFSAITWAENIPYFPIQPIIKEILGEKPDITFAKILPGQTDLYPLLSGILGIDVAPTDRTRFLSPIEKADILRRLLIKLLYRSFSNRTLAIFDNAENLDPSTALLVDSMIKEAHFPIIIAGRNADSIESTTDIRLSLSPFDKRKTAAFLREILSARRIGAEVVKSIHSETGGNPGYIAELTALLSERGQFAVKRGVYRLTGTIEGELPRGIEGVYTARIDCFPPDARETIRVSSVLGPVFQKTMPTKLMDRNIYENGVEYLLSSGILQSTNGNYHLTSRPLSKAAYLSMFQAVRKSLHAGAGTAIESDFTDELEAHYEELARHFSRGGVPEKAFNYNILSGRKQEAKFANSEALHYYEIALEVTDDSAIEWNKCDDLFAALESAGKLHWYSGNLHRVIELNTRAKALAERLEDRLLFSDAVNRIALAKQELGLFDEAKQLYESQLATLRELDEKERLLQAMVNYGTLLSDLGDLDAAKSLYEKGIEITNAKAASAGAANLLGNLGWLESQRQNWNAAEEYLHRAGLIDAKLGNLRGRAINTVNIAQVHRARGAKDKEIEAYEEAMGIFKRIGDIRGETLCLSNLGDTARETMQIERANSLHRKALKLAREMGDKMRILDAQLGLALDSAAEGDLVKAINRARNAMEVGRECGDWEGEIEAGLALLDFLQRDDRRSEFAKCARKLRKVIIANNPAILGQLEKLE